MHARVDDPTRQPQAQQARTTTRHDLFPVYGSDYTPHTGHTGLNCFADTCCVCLYVCTCVCAPGRNTHTHTHTHMHSTIHPIATVSATASDAPTTTHFDFSPLHLVDPLSRDATYTTTYTHTYHNRNMYSTHHSHHIYTSIVVVVVIAALPLLFRPTHNVRVQNSI